jgi:hypothetical protein
MDMIGGQRKVWGERKKGRKRGKTKKMHYKKKNEMNERVKFKRSGYKMRRV